jgi:hypothetical protein
MKLITLLAGIAGAYLLRPKTRIRTDTQWGQLCLDRQKEAWTLGLEAGTARGNVEGHQHAFAAIEQAIRERGAVLGEVTAEDLARAKRGMVH